VSLLTTRVFTLDPGSAAAQDHSGTEGDPARAMRALTASGVPTQVFRLSGECSPRRETEGADGGGVCPAYALGPKPSSS